MINTIASMQSTLDNVSARDRLGAILDGCDEALKAILDKAGFLFSDDIQDD